MLKSTGKLSLCSVTYAFCHETKGGVSSSSTILDLGTRWKCRQRHIPAVLPPEPIGGQESCWAPVQVWTLENRKISWPCQEWNLSHPAHSCCFTLIFSRFFTKVSGIWGFQRDGYKRFMLCRQTTVNSIPEERTLHCCLFHEIIKSVLILEDALLLPLTPYHRQFNIL
jgi:hypothetical protein